MSTTPIELLSDDRNFGQWLEKINEVITGLTANDTSTADAQSKIDAAIATGQMGVAVTATSFDACEHSGLYHINANGTLPAANLYVASNGTCITQLKITEEPTPKISIRSKSSSAGAFSNWIELAEKYYTEDTFLKLIGGKITGNLNVTGRTTTGTLHSGTATFVGNINLQNSTSNLEITNDASDVYFDGNKNSSPHIAYYVNTSNGAVSTDRQGKNIEYYIHTDKNNSYLSHYNIEYYIHSRLNTLDSVETGKTTYYIQKDNRVTQTINDNTTSYYKEGNVLLNTLKTKLRYFILDDYVYNYTEQLYIIDDVVYSTESNNELYKIENSSEVVYYATGSIDRNENIVTLPNKTERYYIHNDDGKEYLSLYEEKGVRKDFYITDYGIFSDEACNQLVYRIVDDVIIQRIVMYYIHEETDYEGNSYVVWCVLNDKGEKIPSLYCYKDKVILLANKPTYKVVRYLDTITVDEDGLNTRFFIQKNNFITSDIDGVQEIYIINYKEGFVSSIHTSSVPVFYIWKKNKTDENEKPKLITQTPRYYIQPMDAKGNNPISSDKDGHYVEFLYSKSADNIDLILYNNKPIRINLLSNVCDINGNAKTADELNPRGFTHSFESGETNLAASGKALMDFNNQIRGNYIPYTGGTFTGYVIHSNDIILGKNAMIRAYENLNFHSQGEMSFIVNSGTGKIFIDKQDSIEVNQDGELVKLPCVFGGRTRTGITNAGDGKLMYNLGSIEFTEDNTRIRYRKANATNVNNNVDTVNDISLYLTPTTFHPSVDNVVSLGTGANRFAQIYSVTDNIVTADETSKTSIDVIDSSLLTKWKNVEWKSYKLKSAVDEKGPAARFHTGLIAEEVYKAIPNATSYGFFCKDNETLSIRYQEAQAIENAYLRKEIASLKDEIASLKDEIASLKD